METNVIILAFVGLLFFGGGLIGLFFRKELKPLRENLTQESNRRSALEETAKRVPELEAKVSELIKENTELKEQAANVRKVGDDGVEEGAGVARFFVAAQLISFETNQPVAHMNIKEGFDGAAGLVFIERL